MIGHTKLPWHADDDRVNFGAGLLVAECYGGTTKESIANAAFICKAVNSHEALVAMLEEAREEQERLRNELIERCAKTAEMAALPAYGTHARHTGREEARKKIAAAIRAMKSEPREI